MTDRETGCAISDERYEAVLDALRHAPTPEAGTALFLRIDLSWEALPEPETEEQASAEDYEAALNRLGVDV